ncbi:MAG: hypothetical protein EOO41_00180, partial [Methanobacteriota archaeon]
MGTRSRPSSSVGATAQPVRGRWRAPHALLRTAPSHPSPSVPGVGAQTLRRALLARAAAERNREALLARIRATRTDVGGVDEHGEFIPAQYVPHHVQRRADSSTVVTRVLQLALPRPPTQSAATRQSCALHVGSSSVGSPTATSHALFIQSPEASRDAACDRAFRLPDEGQTFSEAEGRASAAQEPVEPAPHTTPPRSLFCCLRLSTRVHHRRTPFRRRFGGPSFTDFTRSDWRHARFARVLFYLRRVLCRRRVLLPNSRECAPQTWRQRVMATLLCGRDPTNPAALPASTALPAVAPTPMPAAGTRSAAEATPAASAANERLRWSNELLCDDLIDIGFGCTPVQTPLLSSQVVLRLGASTVFTCTDRNTVTEVDPVVETVMLLKGETGSAIIDLHTDDASAQGLRFDDRNWRLHLSSLKPVGLACLLNAGAHAAEGHSSASDPAAPPPAAAAVAETRAVTVHDAREVVHPPALRQVDAQLVCVNTVEEEAGGGERVAAPVAVHEDDVTLGAAQSAVASTIVEDVVAHDAADAAAVNVAVLGGHSADTAAGRGITTSSPALDAFFPPTSNARTSPVDMTDLAPLTSMSDSVQLEAHHAHAAESARRDMALEEATPIVGSSSLAARSAMRLLSKFRPRPSPSMTIPSPAPGSFAEYERGAAYVALEDASSSARPALHATSVVDQQPPLGALRSVATAAAQTNPVVQHAALPAQRAQASGSAGATPVATPGGAFSFASRFTSVLRKRHSLTEESSEPASLQAHADTEEHGREVSANVAAAADDDASTSTTTVGGSEGSESSDDDTTGSEQGVSEYSYNSSAYTTSDSEFSDASGSSEDSSILSMSTSDSELATQRRIRRHAVAPHGSEVTSTPSGPDLVGGSPPDTAWNRSVSAPTLPLSPLRTSSPLAGSMVTASALSEQRDGDAITAVCQNPLQLKSPPTLSSGTGAAEAGMLPTSGVKGVSQAASVPPTVDAAPVAPMTGAVPIARPTGGSSVGSSSLYALMLRKQLAASATAQQPLAGAPVEATGGTAATPAPTAGMKLSRSTGDLTDAAHTRLLDVDKCTRAGLQLAAPPPLEDDDSVSISVMSDVPASPEVSEIVPLPLAQEPGIAASSIRAAASRASRAHSSTLLPEDVIIATTTASGTVLAPTALGRHHIGHRHSHAHGRRRTTRRVDVSSLYRTRMARIREDDNMSLHRLAQATLTIPPRTYLLDLAREIGFTPADVSIFQHVRHVYTMVPGGMESVVANSAHAARAAAAGVTRRDAEAALVQSERVKTQLPPSRRFRAPAAPVRMPDVTARGVGHRERGSGHANGMHAVTAVPRVPNKVLPRSTHFPWVKAAMTATVVRDTRTSRLQMMSQGNLPFVLANCSDYWDGNTIWPLTSHRRRALLAMYQQWRSEDLYCVALAYDPVSNQEASVFRLLDAACSHDALKTWSAQKQASSGIAPSSTPLHRGKRALGSELPGDSVRAEQQPAAGGHGSITTQPSARAAPARALSTLDVGLGFDAKQVFLITRPGDMHLNAQMDARARPGVGA